MPELQDWLRAFALLGRHGTDYVVVAVDADGQLYALVKGEDGSGDLHTLAVDTDGQLIMVPRGSTGNYLAVDASGYLTTVIKGDYEGELKTIKLDDEGRLSAFVIDSTDAWGKMLSIGNAELAARLGSILSYDRRGNVVQQTDFGNGWDNWRKSLTAPATLSLEPGIGRMGGYAAKMTGGNIGTGRCTLLTYTPVLPSARVGLAAFLSVPIRTEYLELRITYRTTAHTYSGWVRWDCENTVLQLMTDTPAWIPVKSNVDMYRHAQSFVFFKVVVDVTAHTFERVLFGPYEEDISEYALYEEAPGTYESFYASVTNEPREGTTDVVYCDAIILTVAEP